MATQNVDFIYFSPDVRTSLENVSRGPEGYRDLYGRANQMLSRFINTDCMHKVVIIKSLFQFKARMTLAHFSQRGKGVHPQRSGLSGLGMTLQIGLERWGSQ